MSTTMATGSTSNITTQWTFRDGRDYVLSLTTTEMPNTISVWISDKITGEEWIGSFDDNAIEILTKRTGSYKSFQTFLSMIKSALLKKSDSVIVELLNIEDLTAISFHRQQNPSHPMEGQFTTLAPPNFQFYSGEVNTCRANKNPKPQGVEVNLSTTGVFTGCAKASPACKRKYLIVTYVAEFDKVHYPLPLNYSNPPDLNVMQSNIIKLKAEVTSLKSAKKELEAHLDSIKGGHPFIESNGDGPNPIVVDKDVELNFNLDNGSGGVPVPCRQCSGLVDSLRIQVRDLEDALNSNKLEKEKVEKLESENQFLLNKLEASEKYEIELWDQIQKLREVVDRGHNIKSEPLKKGHRSRHDIFYGKRNSTEGSGTARGGNWTKTTSARHTPLNGRVHSRSPSNYLNAQASCARSRSNSTGSYNSMDLNHLNCNHRGGVSHVTHSRSRSGSGNRSSSYKPLRRESKSPTAGRFDPTGYITDKKQRMVEIARIRLQKMEQSFSSKDSGSRSRFTRVESPIASRSMSSGKNAGSRHRKYLSHERHQQEYHRANSGETRVEIRGSTAAASSSRSKSSQGHSEKAAPAGRQTRPISAGNCSPSALPIPRSPSRFTPDQILKADKTVTQPFKKPYLRQHFFRSTVSTENKKKTILTPLVTSSTNRPTHKSPQVRTSINLIKAPGGLPENVRGDGNLLEDHSSILDYFQEITQRQRR